MKSIYESDSQSEAVALQSKTRKAGSEYLKKHTTDGCNQVLGDIWGILRIGISSPLGVRQLAPIQELFSLGETATHDPAIQSWQTIKEEEVQCKSIVFDAVEKGQKVKKYQRAGERKAAHVKR